MVNLRFHIASLVAVFFALAIGIGVGSSVVRSGVLERTESQLQSLDAALSDRNKALDDARDEKAVTSKVDEALDRRVLDSALSNVSVVVVAMPGVSTKDSGRVAAALARSRAQLGGIIDVQASVRLASDVDSRFAAIAIKSYSTDPKKVAETLRVRLLDAVSATATSQESLDQLRAAKFVAVRDANGKPLEPVGFTLPADARIVVVGAADAKVDGGQSFFLPFLRELGRAKPGGVLVVDPPSLAERDAAASKGAGKGERTTVAAGVAVVRDNASTAARVTTIDGVIDSSGTLGRARRVAMVLSLLDAARKKVGHYGTADGATSLVPSA